MKGFVSPVYVHVMLAEGVAVSVEQLRAGRFVANVLGLNEVEHAQEVDGIFAGGALVDVGPKRNLSRLQAPRRQALMAHAAVPRFVVGPAGGVVDPLPG